MRDIISLLPPKAVIVSASPSASPPSPNSSTTVSGIHIDGFVLFLYRCAGVSGEPSQLITPTSTAVVVVVVIQGEGVGGVVVCVSVHRSHFVSNSRGRGSGRGRGRGRGRRRSGERERELFVCVGDVVGVLHRGSERGGKRGRARSGDVG